MSQMLLGEQLSVLSSEGLFSLYCLCNEETKEFLIFSSESDFADNVEPLVRLTRSHIVSLNAMESMVEIFYDPTGKARNHGNPNASQKMLDSDLNWVNGVQRYTLCNLKPIQSRIWHLHLSCTLSCEDEEAVTKSSRLVTKTRFADDLSDSEDEDATFSESDSLLSKDVRPGIELPNKNVNWREEEERLKNIVKEQQEEMRLQVKNMDFSRAAVAYFTHVKFDMSIFITEFWTHVMYPFSIPYIYYVLGTTYFRNHGFLNCSVLPIIMYNQVLPTLMWFLVIYYFFNDAEFRNEDIYFIEILQITLYIAAHRATVSCKYALMTKEERTLAYTCLDVRKVTKLHMMVQMLTGWLNPTGELTQCELYATALRVQSNLNAYAFMLDPYDADQQECWRKFLMMDKEDPRYADWQSNKWPDFSKPVSQIPIAHVMTALFRRAVDRENKQGTSRNIGKFAITFSKAIIPGLIRVVILGKPFAGTTMASNILVFAAIFCLMAFYLVVLNIIQSSVVHYARRYQMAKEVGYFIRSDYTIKSTVPMLSTSNPANIVAWAELRNLVMNFGSRYSMRLQYYTSFTLLVSGLYFAWFVGQFLLSLLSGAQTQDINYILLFEVLYDSVLWTSLILSITLIGTRTNRHNFVQRVNLSQIARKFLDSVWVCRKRGFPRISWHTENGYLNFRIPFGSIRINTKVMKRRIVRQLSVEGELPMKYFRSSSITGMDMPSEDLLAEASVDDRELFVTDVPEGELETSQSICCTHSPLVQAKDVYVPELQSGLQVVEWAMLQLQVQDTTSPETVLGIRADVALTNGLVTMLVSVLVFALQRLMISNEE